MWLLGLALALIPAVVLGDVEFTSPSAGAHVDVGTINVQWKESGIAPLIKDLAAYSLVLVVGGNNEDDMLPIATFVSAGNFASGNSASGTIPSGIAGPVTNGFFFKIISSANGEVVINYSDRFSIKGLTGTTLEQYRDAAEALNGSTKGPVSVGDSPVSASPSVSSTTAVRKAGPTYTNTIMTVTKKPSTTAPPTVTATKAPKRGDRGLSTSILVGVAIAGAAIGLIGVGLAIWAICRRKRRKEQGPEKLDGNGAERADASRGAEMSVVVPVELDPHAKIVEADDGERRPEMDSNNIRAELEGDHSQFGRLDYFEEPLTPVPDTPIENLTLGPMDHYTVSTDTLPTPATPVTPRFNV